MTKKEWKKKFREKQARRRMEKWCKAFKQHPKFYGTKC